MIIIRTNGGNPPFDYVINSSADVYTTQDSLLVVYEDDYLVDDIIVEEILITESDILLSNLPGNSWHTISIIDDEYGCLEFPVGYSLYVGSDDSDCLFIPSVFTPNGDGLNDLFQIQDLDPNVYSESILYIYNKWGGIVYMDMNYGLNNNWWDGQALFNNRPFSSTLSGREWDANQDHVSDGIYYYVLEAYNSLIHQKELYSGEIMIFSK